MTLSHSELTNLIVESLLESPYSLTILDDERSNPLRIALSGGDLEVAHIFRIFVWNITHGGGAVRPDSEFRIQLTGRMPDQVAGETTLVLGWSEQFEAFAGWDASIHAGRTSRSPSLQVRRETLELAFDVGLAAAVRNSGDVVVAFTRGMLATYCASAESIRSEPQQEIVSELNSIPSEVAELESGTRPPQDRKKVVRTVESHYRAWDFNRRIIAAYGARCAICSIQLQLVEAAHIVPVAWPGSTDATNNGIALCRNHHRAYDAGLLSVDEHMVVHVSKRVRDQLMAEGLSGGLSGLMRHDGNPLEVIPGKPEERPRAEFLQAGQTSRRWDG